MKEIVGSFSIFHFPLPLYLPPFFHNTVSILVHTHAHSITSYSQPHCPPLAIHPCQAT